MAGISVRCPIIFLKHRLKNYSGLQMQPASVNIEVVLRLFGCAMFQKINMISLNP